MIALYVLDISFTMFGQPAKYWDGERSAVIEANPLAHRLLQEGPGWFAGLAVIWGTFLGCLVMLWPSRIAVGMAIFTTVAHAVGSASWFVRLGDIGWALAAIYLVAASQACRYCWRRYARGPVDQGSSGTTSPSSF